MRLVSGDYLVNLLALLVKMWKLELAGHGTCWSATPDASSSPHPVCLS